MRRPADIPATEVVIDGVVVARVDARRPGLTLVDELTRRRLEAQRRGEAMSLRGVGDDLGGLLELLGLAEVLGLEPRRKPELGEQLGVEEVVQPRDPLP
jgi:hypothetical protein